MAKNGLTKAQESKLQENPVLRACYLEKSKYMGEREAFAACTKEARDIAKKEAVKARAAQKEAAKKSAAAKKAAERQEAARKKAEEKALAAARVEASPKASPARKARAKGAARLARKTARKEKEIAQVAASSAAKSIVRADSAQARTVAMHKGIAPAPAVEAAQMDVDALILLSETERKKVLAAAGKSQRRLLARDLAQLARRTRTDIASLKSARRQRLRVLKQRAKEGLSMIRRRIVEARTRYLQEMARLKAETAETRSTRSKGIEEVQSEIGPALGQATAKQRAIRDTQSEIRSMKAPPTEKQLKAKTQRLEARSESDDTVARELEVALPGAEKWWRAEGQKQKRFAPKNVPAKMSRAEHVMHALSASPQILDDFFEKKAAAVLKAKEAELKAIAKRQGRKAIQRTQRATRRFGLLRPRGPSRGRPLEAPAPF